MLIEGQFTLQAPIQKVWDSLLDPKTLGTCVPGTEKMEAIDKETYESVVAQRVGPFKVKLKFTTKLTEVRPPNYIKAVGRGADVTKLGNFSTEIEVKLNETSPNTVDVSYAANVSLVGRLALADLSLNTKHPLMEIGPAELSLDDLSEGTDHRIADVMPEFIVDVLEMIDIRYHQCEFDPVALRPGVLRRDHLVEPPAVCNPGQLVGLG